MYSLAPRAGEQAAAKSSLSSQTIIIIAVCASVGGLILAAVLYRTLRKFCRTSSVPLPPVQPHARQREQHLRAYHDSTYLSPPRRHPPNSTSNVSLLGKESIPDSRPTSLTPTSDECPSEDVLHAPLQLADPLVPPPSFRVPRPSPANSIASKTTDSYCPSPFTSSAAVNLPPNPDNTPPSQTPRRPRPTSFSSPPGTLRSKSSRSVIRGAPHRSAVQIVLPAPLASEVVSYNHTGSDRRSVVDKWIHTGRDSIYNVADERPSITQSASWTAPSSRTPSPRRAPSIPSSHTVPPSPLSRPYVQDLASMSLPLPPVPPLPSDVDMSTRDVASRSRDDSPVPRSQKQTQPQ